MSKAILLDRLNRAHPGWPIWDELVALAGSLDFDFISSEYQGNHFTCGSQLVFRDFDANVKWVDWLPTYVQALYGMKADYWEMAGGFADIFCDLPARQGAVFSPAGNDAQLGFPIIAIPDDTYPFQSNSSGASFFVNKRLNISYPNPTDRQFEILDTLEAFTKTNIRQVVKGAQWFDAYCDKIKGDLLD